MKHHFQAELLIETHTTAPDMATQLQLETQTETSLPIHTTTATDAAPPKQEMATDTKKKKKQFADLSKEVKELIIERVCCAPASR